MDSNESSLLPFELCEEILCRVPTKSLLRFKLTCKRWLELFKNKRFINKHLAFIQEHFIRIDDPKVKIINPMTGACSSFSIPEEFRAKPQIYTMIHCNGLLLCILESSAIAVWNPCLNQVRWIKPLSYHMGCFLFGIGYENLSRDCYKIMRFIKGGFTKNEYANTGSYNPEVDIYDFNSDSWRTFRVSLEWHVVSRCRGVSLKGNMYWIAKWNRKPNFFIQSFNFSTKKFEPLCSLPFEYDSSHIVNLSAFRQDNLSLLHYIEETSKMEVWVTNKIKNGVNISWTKFFNVTSPDLPLLREVNNMSSAVHFIDKNNKIALCCEEVLADEKNVRNTNLSINIYLIGEGEIKKHGEIERHRLGFSWPFISGYAYLPSLVPVPT